MEASMISLHVRPLAVSVSASRLRTSYVHARACSTGLPSLHIHSARSAVHHASRAPLATLLHLLPPSSSHGSKTGRSDGKPPLGGGGCGGGGRGGGAGGGRNSKPGSGDEDDRPGKGFRKKNNIVELLCLLGLLKEPLLASAEEMLRRPSSSARSSNSTHEISRMGDGESHYDVSSNDQQVTMPVPLDNRSNTSSKRNKYNTRTAEVGVKIPKSQDRHVDTDTSDDETEQKMKGTRSYVFTMAASSLVWAGGLFPYWAICCPDTTLAIPKIWKDALHIGYIFLIITAVILTAHSSRFKDGKLPDNAEFRSLGIVQLVVALCLCVASFIPQHVCRGMSNSVVWPFAAGALFLMVISWALVFQQKKVIKCMMTPCQMVIKCTKVIYEKGGQWLPYLSLPKSIKDKFKKMPGAELPERAQEASSHGRTPCN